MKQTAKEAGSQGSKNSSLVDALLHYVDRANDLINKYIFCGLFNFYSGFFFGLFYYYIVIFYSFSLTRFRWLHLFLDLHLICWIFFFFPFIIFSNPRILLNILNLIKALWQGAAQYTQILSVLRSSENFWKQLSNTISLIAGIKDPPLENLTQTGGLNLAYKYRCQSAILEIILYEMFLQKKLSHAESLVKHTAESKDRIENAVNIEKSKATKDIVSSWCESSVLGNLIKSYSSCEYDNEKYFRAKVIFTSNFLFLIIIF